MPNCFRAQDRKNFDAFLSILNTTGTYLPLDFIIKLFDHAKKNRAGYNQFWVHNALLVTKELCEIHQLSESVKSVIYAVTFLMESGRCYNEKQPHDASAAFAMIFLRSHADAFFDDDETDTILSCCKRVNVMNHRMSVDTAIQLVAHEIRVMTDVVFSDYGKVVVEFVRSNKVPTNDRVSLDEWKHTLAVKFAEEYGRRGSVWCGVRPTVLTYWGMHVRNFQLVADDASKISELVEANYNRIFSKG